MPSSGIDVKLQYNGWEMLGEELARFPKNIVAQENKNTLARVARMVAKRLKQETPKGKGGGVGTGGSLRRSVKTKADKYPSGTAYAIVGYLDKSESGHQFWVTLGTKKRHTAMGYYRGSAIADDAIYRTEQASISIVKNAMKEQTKRAVESAVKKMDRKYGNRWRDL